MKIYNISQIAVFDRTGNLLLLTSDIKSFNVSKARAGKKSIRWQAPNHLCQRKHISRTVREKSPEVYPARRIRFSVRF